MQEKKLRKDRHGVIPEVDQADLIKQAREQEEARRGLQEKLDRHNEKTLNRKRG